MIRVANAPVSYGAFELTVDNYAAPAPSSRGALVFGEPRNGAQSQCDLILDLSGGAPLFPVADLRDGYLRADPGDPAAVLRAVLKAGELVGTFDKPRYITFAEHLCAHSRSRMQQATTFDPTTTVAWSWNGRTPASFRQARRRTSSSIRARRCLRAPGRRRRALSSSRR